VFGLTVVAIFVLYYRHLAASHKHSCASRNSRWLHHRYYVPPYEITWRWDGSTGCTGICASRQVRRFVAGSCCNVHRQTFRSEAKKRRRTILLRPRLKEGGAIFGGRSCRFKTARW
jgi:hypothetical protein